MWGIGIALVLGALIAYLLSKKNSKLAITSSKIESKSPENLNKIQENENKRELEFDFESKKSDNIIGEDKNEKFNFGDTKFALPSLTILYGTQSGTGERFAKELKIEALSKGWNKVEVIDLENYDSDSLSDEELVVLIVATYIEGKFVFFVFFLFF